MGFKIEFARGDSYAKGFVLKDNSGRVVTDTFDEIYFTAKKSFNDKDFKLQKRQSTGDIVNDGNGHYTINFVPSDTDNLSFADYDCDIEFRNGESFKKTFTGVLTLTKEATYRANEG